MMHRKHLPGAIAVSVAAAVAATGFAQLFKYSQTEATTARYDAQRSGWVRTDHFIAPDKMGSFALQWKTKVNVTGSTHAALSQGIVSAAGLGITLAYLGTADNRTVAIDMDNGHVFYNHAYGAAPAATAGCVSASVVALAKPTTLTPAPSPAPTAAGQAKVGPNTQLPFGSVLGEPGEGIPPVKPGSYFATRGSFFGAPNSQSYDGTKESAATNAAFAADYKGAVQRPGAPPVSIEGGVTVGLAPAPPAGGGGPTPPGAPAAVVRPNFGPRGGGPAFAVSADGMLHALTTNDGLDAQQPTPFLPAGAQAGGLILINGTAYATSMNGCGGTPNGLWSVASAATAPGSAFPKPMSWTTGGTASPHEPAFNADGVVYLTVGSGTGKVSDAVVALAPKTLEQKSAFTQPGANFATAPVIFREDKQDIIAAEAADGRVFLFDGADISKPLFVSSAANLGSFKPTSMATWKDANGQRWLLTTTATTVNAWKVTLSSTTASLTEGWKLSGLKAPLAPLVINGIVFALSSGEGKANAELFAVDGISGKTLWTSGKTITAPVPTTSGLWNSMGQVLVGTADDVIYAFGMTMERHL